MVKNPPKEDDHRDLVEKFEFLVNVSPDCFQKRLDRKIDDGVIDASETNKLIALIRNLNTRSNQTPLRTLFNTNQTFKN